MTKLHFNRIRAVGEPTFYDAQTDIRQLLPAISKICVINLQERYKEDAAAVKDFLFIQKCINIFQLRTVEDPLPVAKQVEMFFKAMEQVNRKHFVLWLEMLFHLLFSIYALFCRRDSKTDRKELLAMFNAVGIANKEYDPILAATVQNNTNDDGFIVDENGKEYVNQVKAVARFLISAEGDQDWDSIAAACDEYAEKHDTDITQGLVCALAYPTYSGELTAEVEDDEHTGKD